MITNKKQGDTIDFYEDTTHGPGMLRTGIIQKIGSKFVYVKLLDPRPIKIKPSQIRGTK